MSDFEGVDVMQASALALGAVVQYYNELSTVPTGAHIDLGQVRLVWFCKTLENWKALVITTLTDNLYYEVTYSGRNRNTCVDVYQKVDSVLIPDEGQVSSQEQNHDTGELSDAATERSIYEDYKSFEQVHGADNDPRWNVQQVPQPDPGRNWNPGD